MTILAPIRTAEEAVSDMVGKAFSGVASPTEPESIGTFVEFDADFQTKVATHALRDLEFMRKVAHLIRPEYFENVGEAAWVNIAVRFYKETNQLPSRVIATELFKKDVAARIIRGDVREVAKTAFAAIFGSKADISNGAWMAEQVATFARHQAVSSAILQSVDLLQSKQFDKIEKTIKMATEVGINTDGDEYDYYEKIAERTTQRQQKKLGILPDTGITTGFLKMDELLYHRGWGKRELSVIMGGPKSGKTTFLLHCARAASLAGKNVLYVTLEVSAKIISDRLDAAFSDTLVRDLMDRMHDVEGKVRAYMPRAGALKIHEFPSGSFTPSQLGHLIERYKSPKLFSDGSIREAIKFDMVVVDYADIMAPDNRVDEARENSKSVWLALRAIAFKEDVAMLSATQTNRDGMKSAVAKMEHVSDDINKVRTVDILISININEAERATGDARLHFAASRNQESGFCIFIKQNLAKMQFITSIVRIE